MDLCLQEASVRRERDNKGRESYSQKFFKIPKHLYKQLFPTENDSELFLNMLPSIAQKISIEITCLLHFLKIKEQES